MSLNCLMTGRMLAVTASSNHVNYYPNAFKTNLKKISMTHCLIYLVCIRYRIIRNADILLKSYIILTILDLYLT